MPSKELIKIRVVSFLIIYLSKLHLNFTHNSFLLKISLLHTVVNTHVHHLRCGSFIFGTRSRAKTLLHLVQRVEQIECMSHYSAYERTF